jgi:hypothetical protein
MQTDNVETLRRYHDLLNETGEPPVGLLHPEVEVHMFLIVRFHGYRDRAEALAAAGLNDARRTT